MIVEIAHQLESDFSSWEEAMEAARIQQDLRNVRIQNEAMRLFESGISIRAALDRAFAQIEAGEP